MRSRVRASPYFVEDGKWKDEPKKWPPTDDEIVAFALGDVKYDVPRYLNNRKGNERLKLETRYMKKWDKGTGLKAIVRSRNKPDNLQKL